MYYTEVRTKPEAREQILKTLQEIEQVSFVGESTEDPNLLVVHFDVSLEEYQVEKLKHDIETIPNVDSIGDMSGGRTIASIHCFFDIDGTLTDPQKSVIGLRVREIFEYLRKVNILIYLSTGRSIEEVRKQQEYFSPLVEKYAIAENGGVLIDPTTKDGIDKFGNTMTQPQRFYTYLLKKKFKIKLDDEQRNRETEVVILKDGITHAQITAARTEAYTNELIKADVLRAGSTYHIMPRGVNKGSMIANWLNKRKLSLELNKIVSVGDTELDVSMFEESQISYLMGTAEPWLKLFVSKQTEAGILRTTVLNGTFLQSLSQIYEDMAKLAQ